jgi:hypothetical protein
MMSISELSTAKVNPDIAREAFLQSSARLADLLDTKKSFEQKAFTLFSGYMTAVLAAFGVAAAVYKDYGFTTLSISFTVAGLALLAGEIFFVIALYDSKYGAAGSEPEMWLKHGVIDANNPSTLPRMLAAITFHHGARIEASIESNDFKGRLIRRGIYCGVAMPVLFLIAVIVTKALLKNAV